MARTEKIIKVLQANINHCRLAHNLLLQAAVDLEVDVVITAEPLYNPGKWIFDESNSSATWFTGRNGFRPCDDETFVGLGYVGGTVKDLTFVSTYESPNSDTEAYDGYLERLISMRRELSPRVILAGDFNAHSPSWGSTKLTDRGEALQDALGIMRLEPIESDRGPTFERNGRTSKIDFAAMDRVTERRLRSSKVLDMFTGSDHRYLLHEIEWNTDRGPARTSGLVTLGFKRWNGKTLIHEKLRDVF